MKKQLSILFVLSFCFLALMDSNADALEADLVISDHYIMVGESFSVGVYAEGDAAWGDLVAFGFNVDPLGALDFSAYVDFTIGPDYDGLSGTFADIEGTYWPLGLDQTNVGENVLLATLNFIAKDPGTDLLFIQGLLPDTIGVFYEFDEFDLEGNINIVVNETAPVPEPATVFLLGIGIAGLAGLGRKRFRRS